MVASDLLTDKNYHAANKGLGDGLMIIGATCYGMSNGLEEYFIRKRPLYEVVGMMGFWGTIINGIQAASVEHHSWHRANWNGATIGILIAYTVSMLCLYTVAPILFRLSSSPFYNLSILTSDFYGLLFGLFLYHYKPYWLYFVAYVLVIAGLIIYFSVKKPEEESLKNHVVGRERLVGKMVSTDIEGLPTVEGEIERDERDEDDKKDLEPELSL